MSNELIGVHFSRQSQPSDPKGMGIRCFPITHFAVATVDWMCETDCTAWILANERIPFRWVTDDEATVLDGVKLLYLTAPEMPHCVWPVDMGRITAPSYLKPDRPRYPISSDFDLTDHHFAPGATLEGFHAIQAFNMISRVSTELGSIAGALKDPRVTKLVDVVLAPARAVIAASIPPPPPPPVPGPNAEAIGNLLKARDLIDQAVSQLKL